MRPQAVFFDLDDTLIDRAGAFARYLEDLFSRHPAVFPREHWDEARATLHALDQRGYTDRLLFCREATLAFPALPLCADALWDDFSRQLPRFVRPRPEIRAFVEWVTRRWPVAVVSNGSSRVQRAKLEHAGLADVLPALFLSGEVGVSKPEPGIFSRALAHVGRAPHEVLHVGDDPLRDIAGAGRSGLASCWVSDGRDWPEAQLPPTLVVHRVEELARVLA